MKLTCLVENTEGVACCGAEHGLSYYIETERHRLLMDTGASDLMLRNAEKIGIDLTGVDTVILSHGHHDHGGGILPFSEIGPSAKIFIQADAAGDFYSDEVGGELRYIGLDKRIFELPQVVAVRGDLRIDDELFLMSGIGLEHPLPSGCLKQRMMTEAGLAQDDFRHEQCLVISQGEKIYLFSGCAHHGILNIMDRFREAYGRDPDAVFSGMHMMKRFGAYTEEEIAQIEETAEELAKTGTVFYTGHCTGLEAFDIMKSILGDRLCYVHSGDSLSLDLTEGGCSKEV